MKEKIDDMDTLLDSPDLIENELNILPPIVTEEEKTSRSPNKDRSAGKYSEDDFLALPRDVQFELAEKYWLSPTAKFDDGTFKFSCAHFAKICAQLGFEKRTIIVDTHSDIKKTCESDMVKIYIDHGTRSGAVERKFTLQKETASVIDALFDDSSSSKISNMEKSKIVDTIIRNSFEKLLEKKKNGNLIVAYRPVEETRLI